MREGASVEPRAGLFAADVRKRFGATQALTRAHLSVAAGEVHGLVGANGAGKSTLVAILSGALHPDEGVIGIGPWRGPSTDPRSARRLGLATIRQEPSLALNLSVAANLDLGREASVGPFLRRRKEFKTAAAVLERVGLDVDPATPAEALSAAGRQLLEVAKALHSGARTFILDEPTAVLGKSEADNLLTVVRELAHDGAAVLYISHHLEETLQISRRVTIMRNGRTIGTTDSATSTPTDLISGMIGRDVARAVPRAEAPGREVLTVSQISQESRLSSVTFTLRAGEVVGITGLVGSGRSRLARVLFGAERPTSGAMTLEGRPYRPRDPRAAIAAGVGMLSEDRSGESLFMNLSLAENIGFLRQPGRAGFVDPARLSRLARTWINTLGIRTASERSPVAALSGGNQQKAAIARWLHRGARVMIFDEPGQGVDVGAKEDILTTIVELAGDGCAVVVVSSDLDELTQVANRILVMRRGRIVGELPSVQATEQRVLELSMGTEASEELLA